MNVDKNEIYFVTIPSLMVENSVIATDAENAVWKAIHHITWGRDAWDRTHLATVIKVEMSTLHVPNDWINTCSDLD